MQNRNKVVNNSEFIQKYDLAEKFLFYSFVYFYLYPNRCSKLLGLILNVRPTILCGGRPISFFSRTRFLMFTKEQRRSKTIFISCIENSCPMQFRRPAANGMNQYGLASKNLLIG